MLSTQKFFNQNCSDEGIPSDNLGLARLSYVNIFQDSQPQWIALRYVDEDVFLPQTSRRAVVVKLKVKNLIFLLKTL